MRARREEKTKQKWKKLRTVGQAESIISTALGCGQARGLTRFDTYVRKRFQSPLQESGEGETRPRWRLSVMPMNDVTRILSAIEQGDSNAAEQLLPLVYEELRKLAAQRLAEEKPGQTLQPTALVHEAYVRLVDVDFVQPWDSRGHFFAAAAEAMRRILVEQARRKGRERHGGGLKRVDLLADEIAATPSDDQILALDAALTRLAAVRPQAAELVKQRFFSGLTVDEAAPVVGVSPRTARRLWVFARAWLRREMESLDGHEP
jgi:RNA polymerase sigma factor (TIGR02999 family)